MLNHLPANHIVYAFIGRIRRLFAFKQTTRPWHMPVVAGLCVGVPLLFGLESGNIGAGKLASVGALVILYLQSSSLVNRMVMLMVCGFGFIGAYALAALFSQWFWLSPLLLALSVFAIHYSLFRLNLNKPPGNFFFTMIACMAIAVPQSPEHIAENTGYLTFGVLTACFIGLVYSLITLKKEENSSNQAVFYPNKYVNITESVIFGTVTGISLLAAKWFQMPNPYWIPVSCMAVMQGISTSQVFTRAVQRILGTVFGLALAWCVLQLHLSVWSICVCILLLQVVVEFLVVRNYAIAVVFISMLTIFLAEPNISLMQNPGLLIRARLLDTLTGSCFGAVGGWLLYHEQLHFFSKRQMRKSELVLRKLRDKPARR